MGTGPSRTQVFFGLFLLAALNAFFGHALRAVEERGLADAAFALFGISAILWLALAAGLSLLAHSDEREALRNGDLAVAGLVVAAALVPAATLSSVALTVAAIWAIWDGKRGGALRRAGIIFFAMSGALIWGRLLLATFSGPLLAMDAVFVSSLLGGESQGNALWIDDPWNGLIVAPGCSSMQGMSLALVFWATVNQHFAVPFGWRAAACCLAALAATIAINVLRIGAMLRWPEHHDAIHNGWGYEGSMWATLILVVAICLWGARREVFVAH